MSDLALGAILAAKEQKIVPEFMDDLDLISAVLADYKVKNALANVSVPAEVRFESIKKIFGDKVEPLSVKTMGLLMEYHLIGSFDLFQQAAEDAARENAGYHICRAVTAVFMNEVTQKKLKTVLEKKLSGTVKLRCDVDPNIIGGLSVTCGDWRYMNTVQSKLQQLSRHLITTN